MDNGKGFPTSQDSGNLESLGMKLINVITKQLGGEYSILSGEGARFQFDFNLEK